jgi:hypothetical protein
VGGLAYIEEQARSSPSQRFIFEAFEETPPLALPLDARRVARLREAFEHRTHRRLVGKVKGSGENLTFGTLANRSKPAETQASLRYHPLRSHH